MEIRKTMEDDSLTFALEGRLDTNTAPLLAAELEASLPDTDSLIFDFSELSYISSAGLRELLTAQKAMNARKGRMKVRNVCDIVAEVFEVTGFSDILTIE